MQDIPLKDNATKRHEDEKARSPPKRRKSKLEKKVRKLGFLKITLTLCGGSQVPEKQREN
jgi:hypothetical protein